MNPHLVRIATVQGLQELLAEIQQQPDSTKGANLTCGTCGLALTIRQGRRHNRNYHVYHPTAACEHSERFTHLQATEYGAAVAEFQAK